MADDLVILGHIADGIEALCAAMAVVVGGQDRQAQDDLYPPVLVIRTGAGALRQAIDRQAARGNGGASP